MSYMIVRHYANKHRKYTLAHGLTLEEAQSWCSDPNTSWRTCTSKSAKACTRRNGPWFDSYQKE